MKIWVCDKCRRQGREHDPMTKILAVHISLQLNPEEPYWSLGDLCQMCREDLDRMIDRWLNKDEGRG